MQHVKLPGLALAALLAACGDDVGHDDLTFAGQVGQPVDAHVISWVPYVRATVSGSTMSARPLDMSPVDLLVDTGAPRTSLDAELFGLHGNEVVTADIDAFGLTLENREIETIALPGESTHPDQCTGLLAAGLFGGDILRHFTFAADYRAGKAALMAAGADPPVEGDAGAVETARVRIGGGDVINSSTNLYVPPTRAIVSARIEGMTEDLLIDTGASYVTLASDLLAELGAEGRPSLCCVGLAGVEGTFMVDVVRLRSLSVDGVGAVASVPAVAVPPDSELLRRISDKTHRRIRGLLGGTYWRQFAFGLDYAGSALRLKRYAGELPYDPREYVGPGFDFFDGSNCETRFLIAQVWPDAHLDTPEIDIRAGDEIVTIDGRRVGEGDLATVSQASRALSALAPGTTVTFGLLRRDVAGEPPRPNSTVTLPIVDLLPDYR